MLSWIPWIKNLYNTEKSEDIFYFHPDLRNDRDFWRGCGWTNPLPSPRDWEWYKKMLEDAKEYDRKTNQPDCEDPAKLDWFKKMTEILERIEKKLDK